jgi:leader peptidase (prepilin peptidase)/N-methyltransferase
VVAYRLIQGEHFLGRSQCPHCHYYIAWYDLIPVLSYFILRRCCRNCKEPISLLYPFIELLTVCSILLLYYFIDAEYFLAYFVLFSALIVTIRTDLETMLISRWVTIALLPIGLFSSISDQIPIVPLNSILGAAFGYFFLWLIGTIFYAITHKQGIGEGDFELLACIGSFCGVFGAWITILIGSIMGSIIGITYFTYTGTLERDAKLSFGPFLAFGAMIYVLFQDQITLLIIGTSN